MTSSGREQPFPVLLTFDLDAELLWTARDPKNANRPIALSQGSYGWREGMPRILRLLGDQGLCCTFFVPGLIVERHPELMERILKGGHEIAHHSHTHRWMEGLTEAEEREEFEKATEAIVRVSGRKPAGWRSPAAEINPWTMKLLLEYGFKYSSNFFDQDSPYKHIVKGEKTELVELPFAWVLDDAPFFLYSIQLVGRVMQPPSNVLEHWKAEFDTLYGENRYFLLAMHPQIIGRPSRITLLSDLIEYIRRHDRTRFMRCDEAVESLRAKLPWVASIPNQ
jgi:peptidoglycan/xylan/chitin deacetylase (PgdA/CDA1 family)